jgi:hypothetical protein
VFAIPTRRSRNSARLVLAHRRIDIIRPTQHPSLRASQFYRYLLERTGIPDRDKNARLNTVKLIKYSRFRAFLAPFKRRELRCPTLPIGCSHSESRALFLAPEQPLGSFHHCDNTLLFLYRAVIGRSFG